MRFLTSSNFALVLQLYTQLTQQQPLSACLPQQPRPLTNTAAVTSREACHVTDSPCGPKEAWVFAG